VEADRQVRAQAVFMVVSRCNGWVRCSPPPRAWCAHLGNSFCRSCGSYDAIETGLIFRGNARSVARGPSQPSGLAKCVHGGPILGGFLVTIGGSASCWPCDRSQCLGVSAPGLL